MRERLWIRAGSVVTPRCTFQGATIVARAGLHSAQTVYAWSNTAAVWANWSRFGVWQIGLP